MPRILAVDYGTKRVGLAHSDASKKFAFPLRNILREEFFAEIDKLLKSDVYDSILFGIPVKNDGSEGDLAVEIRNIAQKIQNQYNIEILFVDETLSSKNAEDIIISQNLSLHKRKNKRKDKLDALAAAQFLQTFLDKNF